MTAQELREVGMEEAANQLEAKMKLAKKMMIAYEHFRFVTPEITQRFQDALRKKTLKGDKYGNQTYDTLKFQELKKYSKVPPKSVLNSIKKAMEMGCFDKYEVASVETVEVRPDPIVFGVIDSCEDKFFIDQWDNDVKIEDILKESEG